MPPKKEKLDNRSAKEKEEENQQQQQSNPLRVGHYDPVLDAFPDTTTNDNNDEDDGNDPTTSTEAARVYEFRQPGLANIQRQRVQQLNSGAAARRAAHTTAANEDDEDEDEDEDENEVGGSQISRLLFNMLMRNVGGSSGGAGRGGGAGGLFTSMNRGPQSPFGFSQQQPRPSNLVSGNDFIKSINRKKAELLEDHAQELYAPIAASGTFMMKPNPAHVPTASQLRISSSSLSGVAAADQSATSSPTDGSSISNANNTNNNNTGVSSSSSNNIIITASPLSTFWNEYEDSLDDAVLAMAKHELKNERMQEQKQQQQFFTNSNTAAPQEDASSSSSYDENSSSNGETGNSNNKLLAPRNAATKSSDVENNDNQASATPSARADETNNNNNTSSSSSSSEEYETFVGPSSAAPTSSNNNNNSATTTSSRTKHKITRTIPSIISTENNNTDLLSDCVSFLRQAPSTLPSTCRGTMDGSHMMQPISGLSLSSSSHSQAVAYNDTTLFAMGSRRGVLAVGAFEPSQWKAMMRDTTTTANANNSNTNNNADDDDEDDDPEFASMGRRRQSSSNNNTNNNRNFPGSRFASATTRNTLSFPIQHVEMIKQGGPPIFDTAWHPSLPLYAASGGQAEVILGFAGDILKKVSGRGEDDVVASNDDDEDEENDPILSKNILPKLRDQNGKRAKKIAVDVEGGPYRSYVFAVDFFGHDSAVCACSGGSLSTIQIKPDGQFAVSSYDIHTDDVNAVARFGRDPESPLFVSGADDRRVALTDTRVAAGSVAIGKGHTLGIMSMSTRKDDYFFASVGKDQIVKLWDARKLSDPMSSVELARNTNSRLRNDPEDRHNWNHYNSPETAPAPTHGIHDQSSLSMPNSHRFVYTLCRAKFSPFDSTGGRYLLVGGCGGSQIFDIVSGGVVANLVWDDVGSADEVMRDIAWIDESSVMACSQSAAYVFAAF